MRMLIASTAMAGLVLAGCGNGTDPAASVPSPTDAVQEHDDPGSNGDSGTDTDANPSEPTGDAIAVVQIGDLTYEFTLGVCIGMGSAMAADGKDAEGNDISVTIDLPTPGDPESTPYVRVVDRVEDLDWRAAADDRSMYPGVEEGQSQVDDYTVKGATGLEPASGEGTATFFDTRTWTPDSPVEPVQGFFSVRCG